MFARGKDHAAERDHAFLLDSLADNGEGLNAHFAVRGDVVRIVEVELVDFLFRHELVDIYRAGTFDRRGLKFLERQLDLFALLDFILFDDVGLLDFVPGAFVHLAVADAVAGLTVQLMKVDFSRSEVAGKSYIGQETTRA